MPSVPLLQLWAQCLGFPDWKESTSPPSLTSRETEMKGYGQQPLEKPAGKCVRQRSWQGLSFPTRHSTLLLTRRAWPGVSGALGAGSLQCVAVSLNNTQLSGVGASPSRTDGHFPEIKAGLRLPALNSRPETFHSAWMVGIPSPPEFTAASTLPGCANAFSSCLCKHVRIAFHPSILCLPLLPCSGLP